jgi:hypothetical protein
LSSSWARSLSFGTSCDMKRILHKRGRCCAAQDVVDAAV